MANKYYYLVSSLPYLYLEREPLITTERFLGECEKWLSDSDIAGIRSADLKNPVSTGPEVAATKIWNEFDRALRSQLSQARINRKKDHQEKPGDLVRLIMEQDNPLLMEQALEKKRWYFLNSIEAGYYFDTNKLVVYFLKLQILERLRRFDHEKGRSKLQELCEVRYE
jgi:hypothetical protein